MYPKPPPRPTGSTPLARMLQAMWDIHWDPKVSHFVDTAGVKFDKTPGGYVPKINKNPVGTSSPQVLTWLP